MLDDWISKEQHKQAHMRKEQSRQNELWAYKLVREKEWGGGKKIECVNGLAFPLWYFQIVTNSRKKIEEREKKFILFHP